MTLKIPSKKLTISNMRKFTEIRIDFTECENIIDHDNDLYEMLKDRYSGSDLNTIIDCINKVNEFNFLREYIV